MTSEWMKVMLDEIARKKSEAEQARLEQQAPLEQQVRNDEQAPGEPSASAERL